jgi:hypothetical protein
MENESTNDDLPYTLGKWRGLTQYRCKFCAWDTVKGEGAMLAHFEERHRPRPAPRLIQAYDARGRPIEIG